MKVTLIVFALVAIVRAQNYAGPNPYSSDNNNVNYNYDNQGYDQSYAGIWPSWGSLTEKLGKLLGGEYNDYEKPAYNGEKYADYEKPSYNGKKYAEYEKPGKEYEKPSGSYAQVLAALPPPYASVQYASPTVAGYDILKPTYVPQYTPEYEKAGNAPAYQPVGYRPAYQPPAQYGPKYQPGPVYQQRNKYAPAYQAKSGYAPSYQANAGYAPYKPVENKQVYETKTAYAPYKPIANQPTPSYEQKNSYETPYGSVEKKMDYAPVYAPNETYAPAKYDTSYNVAKKNDYAAKEPKIHCPMLKFCKAFVDIPNLSASDNSAAGAVCAYGSDNLNTCSLSRGSSFCILNGRRFGNKEIKITPSGKTFVMCPNKY